MIISFAVFCLSFYIISDSLVVILKILDGLILINIVASVIASYLFYDLSDLYKMKNLEITVCDIYGNRHEHDKAIETSK